VTLTVGLLIANRAAAAETVKSIHTWLYYKDAKTIEQLKPHADLIASVSLFGEPTREFVEQCHKLGVQTYRLVSGRPTAFDTPEHSRATIDKYLNDCRELNLDGIDLDYEGLPAKHRRAYAAFIGELSKKLHADGKKLSICVTYTPGMQQEPSDVGFYDPKTIAASCDLIRVMCYDKHFASSPGHGPTSTAPWARAAMKFWLAHVPREKLVMGMPAYSNDYDLRPGQRGRQVDRPRPAVPKGGKAERSWRPFERIHVYRYQDAAGHVRVFYASDAKSTAAHLETFRKLRLAGFGFWHHAGVTPETWQVVRHAVK
jgi:spore germination protein YaaH